MSKLGIILAYSKSFLGLPYIWGGQHPSHGYDCSGLIQELLASVGFDPIGDQTAKSLYFELLHLGNCEVLPVENQKQAGAILFFGPQIEAISHVAFAIDTEHMIESGGGSKTTMDVKTAIAKQAFVRVRPIARRDDLVACLMPKY